MKRIDAHAHIYGDDPETLDFLAEREITVLNICVAHEDWRPTVRPAYRDLAAKQPERYQWCTTFDLPDFQSPDDAYGQGVIAGLRQDLAEGAVAVKVWKNIGMELRRPDGSMVMIDDPVFTPIFDFLSQEGVPVVMHIGEPRACWMPIVPGKPHASYYRDHPEWHMYGRDDMPSHGDLISARDRVLAQHPGLCCIGAHLGSLEYDVAEVADRLDRYPNFAVDVSARPADLLAQSPSKVREFVVGYQDRILFGTDIVSRRPHSSLSADERRKVLQGMGRTYDLYARYFETGEATEMHEQSSRGLELPDFVVAKIYYENARRWYSRLARPESSAVSC